MDLIGKLIWGKDSVDVIEDVESDEESSQKESRKRKNRSPLNSSKRRRLESGEEEILLQGFDQNEELTSLDQLIVHLAQKDSTPTTLSRCPPHQDQIYLLFPVLNSKTNNITVHILYLQNKRIEYSLRNLFRDRADLSFIFRMQSEDDLVALNTMFELCVVDLRKKQLLLKMQPENEHCFVDHFLLLDGKEDDAESNSGPTPQRTLHILSAQCVSFQIEACDHVDAVIQSYETSEFIFEHIRLDQFEDRVERINQPVEYEGEILGTCLRIKKIHSDFFFMHTNSGFIYRCQFVPSESKVRVFESVELVEPVLEYSLFNFDVILQGQEAIVAQGTSTGHVALHHFPNITATKKCKMSTLPIIQQSKKKNPVLVTKIDSGDDGLHTIVAALEEGSVLRFSNEKQ